MGRNREKRNAWSREYYRKNKKRIRAYQKTRPNYRDKENLRAWRLKNRDKINARRRERYATIPEVKEKDNARAKKYKTEHSKEMVAYARKYAKDHPEWSREQRLKGYARHKDARTKHSREYKKKRRADNGEHVRELEKLARQRNPVVFMIRKQRRRAKEAGIPGSFTATEWKELCAKYDNRCVCCGRKLKLHADHVIPIGAPGSTNYISNYQPLCKSCNSSKGTKTIDYRPLWGNKLMWANHVED